MALDEFLFGKVSNYYRQKAKDKLDRLERKVELVEVKDQLTLMARALTGLAIDIYPAEREGGYKNNAYFLPTSCALFSSKKWNKRFYIFRVFYLHIQHEMNLNFADDAIDTSDGQQKAIETSSKVLTKLFEAYPVMQKWFDVLVTEIHSAAENQKSEPQTFWLYGKWMKNPPQTESDNQLQHIPEKLREAKEQNNLTTLKVRAVEEVILLEVDKKQQEDYVLTHNFEKVETADEFSGTWRDFDGEDDLESHQNALDEISMRYTVRVDDEVHSVYQADFIENTTISESAEVDDKGFHIPYDEWDYRKRLYKPNFCKVYPVSILKPSPDYYTNTIRDHQVVLTGLRKMLSNLNNRMLQQRRQPQGDAFDIDAITDLFVDVTSKHTPSENIYIANRKKEKDISILVLLDTSLSSDGYAAGSRIIDVEKQVSILFGEILNENHVDFAINSFSSKTRNFINYQVIKDFDDSWDVKKHVIGSVSPEGYTRIGGALRHAGALLHLRHARNKWVILLSDGKPNDFDKYEGTYGIRDIEQALLELKQNQINSYALAIEAQSKYYLPQMFGSNHYQILTNPTDLIQSMVKLYEKIKMS